MVAAVVGAAQEPQPAALGSITVEAEASFPACPIGSECRLLTVACPGIRNAARGVVSIRHPTIRARGVVVFLSGAGGTGWWAKTTAATELLSSLNRTGLVTVQVAWRTAWLRSSPGEEVGPAALACRPATMIAWIHEHIFEPLRRSRPARGLSRCGFCVTGNSAGASQAAYALSRYGLDRLLDGVVFTGGPPHGALAKGCLRRPGESAYWYSSWAAGIIDASYGFRSGTGPCANGDAAFEERWQRDAIATDGVDYWHPRTRVVFLFGQADGSGAVAHGKEYAARLKARSAAVSARDVRAGHHFARSETGLAVLKQLLLETPSAARG